VKILFDEIDKGAVLACLRAPPNLVLVIENRLGTLTLLASPAYGWRFKFKRLRAL
jgi:hypothetical protein